MDMAEAADFYLAAARRNIESVRPGMPIFEVSAKTGSGMPEVFQFLRDRLARSRETLAALQTESTV
jgi:hydrogenase nickel incorporation protein HypB